MPTITVRDIPPAIYEKLKLAAKLNHRSISSEIIACIERAVCHHDAAVDSLLANARRLRAKTASHPLTDEEFAQMKTTGRS